MCGIGGIIGPGILEDERSSVAIRLQAALRHRGPDGEGIYTSNDHLATLVHTRLAILDLSSKGQQPMSQGRYTITFNGEIYNFRELRAALAEENEFTTQTDTEVLLALFRIYGSKCLSYLRGMFAFAIWNEANQTCFLARDPFGIKPLYYTVTSTGGIIFASELRALLATGLIKRKLDPIGLDDFLTTGSVAEPSTLIAGVRCLEAGHFLRWEKERVEISRYFDLSFSSSSIGKDAIEVTRDALQDSMRHHLISDLPVGIFLSGGLDSSALLALAVQEGHKNRAPFPSVWKTQHWMRPLQRVNWPNFSMPNTRHFFLLKSWLDTGEMLF